ncbi:hypothetical protein PWP93_23850 [Paraburkholderia sp. A1RI-2L]|uniref:hypothetical protein n=1 Tax=Paraburkholderia sp. A1RI-2L TaxID=3028367 RepID=UPI003B7D2702
MQCPSTEQTTAGIRRHVNLLQGGLSVPVGVGSILASYAWSRDNNNLNQAPAFAHGSDQRVEPIGSA